MKPCLKTRSDKLSACADIFLELNNSSITYTLILYIFFYRKAVCVYYNEPTCGQYLHEDFFKLIHHLLPTLTILTQPAEQNLEAAAGAVLENFANFTGKHLFLISFIQSCKPSGLQRY